MKKILIVAAHPDDEILGCGGFISKYSSEHKIKIIFIAEGSSCRHEDWTSEMAKAEIETRNKSSLKALKFLGVEDVTFFNFICGRLDQKPIIEINKVIEETINDFLPDIVLTHNNSDVNNDHQIIYRSVLMATRPTSKHLIRKLLTFEVLSSSEWAYTENFEPNIFESLTEKEVASKWKALEHYYTETSDFPFPRSMEGIYTLAKYRGMQSNANYAEAFRLIREFKK